MAEILRVTASLLLLIAATGIRDPASGQVVLREGVRVRIAGEGRQLVGVLIQVRPDSVILETKREQRDGLRRPAIHRFDVSRGARRATMLGATIGMLGLGVGALVYGAAESATCELHCKAGDAAALALMGGVAGGIGGSFFRLERWERVTLPSTVFRGSRGGVQLRLRVEL